MSSLRLVFTVFAVTAITGCTSYSTFNPAGRQAEWLAMLGWWLVGLMSLIIVVMGALILWGALRRRGSFAEHAPIDIDGGKRWILIGGVIVPVVVLSTLFVVTLIALNLVPGDPKAAQIDIRVTARQWWWDVTYSFDNERDNFKTANEIHVPVGQPVCISLTSPDVIHSFWVPRLNGKMDVIPGHENYIVLEATKPGVYRGRCAEYCGVQHANMRFTVVAESPEDYQAWLAHQRKPAPEPSDPQLVRGREVFETYACAMCHTVRGTRAMGTVGPDLTHIASRSHIAGIMPNTRARMQAWVVNAQSLKPGVHMPTLDQFEGTELRALSAYLESLK